MKETCEGSSFVHERGSLAGNILVQIVFYVMPEFLDACCSVMLTSSEVKFGSFGDT